jgi:hypothetical protein
MHAGETVVVVVDARVVVVGAAVVVAFVGGPVYGAGVDGPEYGGATVLMEALLHDAQHATSKVLLPTVTSVLQ